MKKPNPIKLNPNATNIKSVKTTPMPTIYPESMFDDLYTKQDQKLNTENNNEDNSKSNKT